LDTVGHKGATIYRFRLTNAEGTLDMDIRRIADRNRESNIIVEVALKMCQNCFGP
jgi:hypothetical protein